MDKSKNCTTCKKEFQPATSIQVMCKECSTKYISYLTKKSQRINNNTAKQRNDFALKTNKSLQCSV